MSDNGDDDYLDEGIKEKRYIVDKSALLKLFKVCPEPKCGSVIDPDDIIVRSEGAAVIVKGICLNNHDFSWASSLTAGEGREKMYIINILLAAFTLFCGLNISQVIELFNHLNLACIQRTLFFKFQSEYLHPIVWMSWCHAQKTEVDQLKEFKEDGGTVAVAGDGKFDSPGWAAKHCTYVIQSLLTKKIIGIWVAEKSMVTSSSKMEPLAAKTLLVNLATEHGLVIDTITTDRSSDLKIMMNSLHQDLPDDYPKIHHEYDVWHWIKSVQKDLWAAGKLVSCTELVPWFSSITNMCWWSFSSSIGNVVMLKEKLGSITEHMCNIHNFPENTEHASCSHGNLEGDRGKAWLDPDSLAITKVKNALHGYQNSRWKDLDMMGQFTHTGEIENFNSLTNKYCPKLYSYSHASMLVRTALAALDHNENTDREQVCRFFLFLVYLHFIFVNSEIDQQRKRNVCPDQAPSW